jgi:hypothetical protein
MSQTTQLEGESLLAMGQIQMGGPTLLLAKPHSWALHAVLLDDQKNIVGSAGWPRPNNQSNHPARVSKVAAGNHHSAGPLIFRCGTNTIGPKKMVEKGRGRGGGFLFPLGGNWVDKDDDEKRKVRPIMQMGINRHEKKPKWGQKAGEGDWRRAMRRDQTNQQGMGENEGNGRAIK